MRFTMVSRFVSALKTRLGSWSAQTLPPRNGKRLSRRVGKSRICPLGFQKLEDRNLLAAATLTGNILFIVGDNTADEIALTENDQGDIVVEVNDLPADVFPESEVAQIVIWGRDGDDRIDNATHKFSEQFGQAGNDLLVGGFVVDSISGGDGDDTIVGRAMDDLLVGGAGNDTLNGEDGNDTLNGGDGDDLLLGADGNDGLYGSAGNDRIWGQAGDDQLIGSEGSDELHGGLGNDTAYGGDDADSIWGGDGLDSLFGGLGDDWISGENGNDHLGGGEGTDFIKGDNGDDYIAGGDGNDRGEGGAGADTIVGGAGSDALFGAAGNDSIRGNDGHDQLDGGLGDDYLEGGDGQDELVGGHGDDRLNGGGHKDRLYGNAGTDWLDGGSGNDGLFGGIGGEADRLTGGAGSDRFLVWERNDKVLDASSLEGVVRFANSAPGYRFEFNERLFNWSEIEIRAVDDSFQTMHDRVGSSVLLKSTTGNSPTLFVKSDGGSRSYRGANYDRGYRLISLNLTDSAVYGGKFDPDNERHWNHVVALVQHEVGHSWDSTSEIRKYITGSDIWNRFVALEERGIEWYRNGKAKENFADAFGATLDYVKPNAERQPIADLFEELYGELSKLGQ